MLTHLLFPLLDPPVLGVLNPDLVDLLGLGGLEVVVEDEDPELDDVPGLVLTLVGLDQGVVLLGMTAVTACVTACMKA